MISLQDQPISSSFQNLVQVENGHYLYDGLGNFIADLYISTDSASYAVTSAYSLGPSINFSTGNYTGNFFGNLLGTASYITNSVLFETQSITNINNIYSSYAETASYVSGNVYVEGISDGYWTGSVDGTSSYAISASYLQNSFESGSIIYSGNLIQQIIQGNTTYSINRTNNLISSINYNGNSLNIIRDINNRIISWNY